MWSSWKTAAKARLISAAVSLMLMADVAAPSIAQEGFSADLGVMRACGGDIWSLCSDVLPDVLRVKSCVANKMGQLSKGCLDKLLDVMAGAQFKVCKDQTYALCAAARCNVLDGVAYCQCDVKHGDSISLPFPMGKDENVCSINAAGAANKYMVTVYPKRSSRRTATRRSTPARAKALTAPTPSATAGSASEAPRRRRSPASTSPCQRAKSFVPAPSLRPVLASPRKAIQFLGLTLATSPSSSTARAPPPIARRVRRSMSAPLLAPPRLWPSSLTARSRRSMSARLDAVRNDITMGLRRGAAPGRGDEDEDT